MNRKLQHSVWLPDVRKFVRPVLFGNLCCGLLLFPVPEYSFLQGTVFRVAQMERLLSDPALAHLVIKKQY
ncbi:MAG TPA: hypothetical protein VL442_11790, partial [Mucilaginibacter sp.]|nr:hypothetical protein [Mucilaginibacter sp.]